MRRVTLFLAALLVLGTACREKRPPVHFSATPEKPEGVRGLAIAYRPALSGSPLERSESVLFRYTLVSPAGRTWSDEAPMTRSGDAWTYAFPAGTGAGSDGVLLVCAFLDAKDRAIFDNNRDEPWVVLFHEKGRPAPGVYLALSRLYGGEIRLEGAVEFPSDRDAARENLDKERAIDPDAPLLKATEWARALRELRQDPVRLDSLRARVREGADAYFANAKEWPAPKPGFAEYLALYDAIRETGARDSVLADLVSRFPADTTLAEHAVNSMVDRRDFEASAARIEDYLSKHPESPKAAGARGLLVLLALDYLHEPDLAGRVVLSGHPVETEHLVSYAEWLAGEGGKPDEAETIYRRCIEEERAKTWAPAGTLSRPEWEDARAWNVARASRGLAAALEGGGRENDALNILTQIVSASPEAAGSETHLALARLEKRAGRPDAALATLDRMAERWTPGVEALAEWRAVFAEARGAGDFDAHAAALAEGRRGRALARLESRVLDQPAPDIAVEDMEGARHALSEHRGKVVLMDFWATWCGPCRRSLPFVDKLARDMAGREDFVVFPVNVWERTRGPERRAAVVEGWKGLGMTIQTYLDPDPVAGAPSAADRFRVPAIPTSFVIGRDGAILFKTVGFAGEEGEEDLRAKIEFALRRGAKNG